MRACAPTGIVALEHDGEPASLLDTLAHADTVVMVDAVATGAAPGMVVRIDAGAGPLPAAPRSASTHGIGVAEAIELGRALGQLPQRLVLFCVVGQDFAAGHDLTPDVARAIAPVADAVLAELGVPGRTPAPPGRRLDDYGASLGGRPQTVGERVGEE